VTEHDELHDAGKSIVHANSKLLFYNTLRLSGAVSGKPDLPTGRKKVPTL
jgi:hypothetical protein